MTGRQAERVLEPSFAITTFEEVRQGYSKEMAIAEARRALESDQGSDLAAAAGRCPFGVDVPLLVAEVAAGRFDEARAAVELSNPWPGTMGRHCGRYCEEGSEASPAIALLERAAADHGARSERARRPGGSDRPATLPSVAIIGAGAAGSSVAYGLRRLGHPVSVVDALERPGGMLFAGYPAFRMPLAVLEEEFDLAGWGASMTLGGPVTLASFEQLRASHAAVVVSSGLHREIPLGVPGEEAEGVLTALELLTAVKSGRSPKVGRDVVVVGAGHTAHDAARTCRRLGAEVTIVYRGTLERMPVAAGKQQRTVDGLAAEGIAFHFESVVEEVLVRSGRVDGVRIRDNGSSSASTQPHRDHACDTVVKATGVYPDTTFLPAELERTDDGLLVVDDRFETSMKSVFALGTIIGTKKTVGALAEGLRAADVISETVKERST